MPYEVKKRGDQYIVRNSQTGKVHGRHPTKAKAQRQMRALYANTKESSSGGGESGSY